MKGSLLIKGIEFPKFIGAFAVYDASSTRDDGSAHESSRILVRVRCKRGQVELLAVKSLNTVYGKYTVDLPRLTYGRASCVANAVRFTFELNQALRNAAEALESDH